MDLGLLRVRVLFRSCLNILKHDGTDTSKSRVHLLVVLFVNHYITKLSARFNSLLPIPIIFNHT